EISSLHRERPLVKIRAEVRFLSSHAGDRLGLVVVLLKRHADSVGQTGLHGRLGALVKKMPIIGGKTYLAIAEFARFLPDQLGHIFASRYASRLQVTAVLHPFDNGLHVLLMLFGEGAIFWRMAVAYLPRPFSRGTFF